jgi:hypothetical protein
MAQRITILLDDDGNAEIRSPKDMTDDEVLDILSAAVDATAEKLLEVEEVKNDQEQAITETLELHRKSKYMN